MKAIISAAAVELRREESRGRLQDLVGAAQLPDLALQLGDPLALVGGHARPRPAVDLGLADPLAQRLRGHPELLSDRQIAAHCEPYSSCCSNTIRTARSRTSAGYLSTTCHHSILHK